MTDVNTGGEAADDASQTSAAGAATQAQPSSDAVSSDHQGGGFAAVDALAAEAPTSATAPSSPAADKDEDAGRIRASLKMIEERAADIRNWSVGRQDAARELVEDRPLAVVGAAFGVGLLLGLVASRV